MNAQTRSAAASPKLRVLALHSFRTSGAIFRQQFDRGMMVERLNDLIELVFMDAPNPASGLIPRDVLPFFEGPYYEWFTVETMGDKLEYDVAKLEGSLALVSKVLKEEGPFDGIIGFSQGAACAASMVALQQAGMALQDIPPLQFCMLFAGFKGRYPPHAPAWNDKVKVPSVHIFGDRDELRPQCKDLADRFTNPLILQHTRGHSIPVLVPTQLAAMRAFLASFTPISALDPTATPAPTITAIQRRNTAGSIEQRTSQEGGVDGLGLTSIDLGGNDGPVARL